MVDDMLLPGRWFLRPDRHRELEQERDKEGNGASIRPQEDHWLYSGG
jgi:hypothetical protein